MKTRTWWTFWPVLPISFFLALVPGMLPTLNVKGEFYGGGPIREFTINKFLSVYPYETQEQVSIFYNSASIMEEYMLYLIPAAHAGLIFMWVSYLLVTIFMNTSNWYENRAYQSKRQTLRR